MNRFIVILSATIALLGCSESEDRSKRFLKFVRNDNKTMKTEQQSDAVFLVKNYPQFLDSVGVIYGYLDNKGTCQMIADAVNNSDPRMKLSCHSTGDFPK